MSRLLEKVAMARDACAAADKARDEAYEERKKALKAARRSHSWGELSEASGLSRSGVKFIVNGEA